MFRPAFLVFSALAAYVFIGVMAALYALWGLNWDDIGPLFAGIAWPLLAWQAFNGELR